MLKGLYKKPERRVRGWASRTALQVEIRCHGVLHRWSEARPEKKAADGHRSIAVYLLDGNRQRFMGTVGVPDRYQLPKEGEIVEVQYLYCYTGAGGNREATMHLPA